MSRINYATLKQLARDQGLRVTDLIALAPANDPFYCGSPGEVEKAHWFADLWRKFGYTTGVHLRRVHYQLISQPDPRKADGKPYENAENDWNYLLNAGKYARYLGLVDPAAFEDRRNPNPLVIAHYWTTILLATNWIPGRAWKSTFPPTPACPVSALPALTSISSLTIWRSGLKRPP